MTIKALVKKWKGNQRYTLRLIEAMPEANFGFKPIEGTKTFKSQASHLASWLPTHSRFVTGHTLDKPSLKTKEEIVQALTTFFESLIAFLENTTDEVLTEIVEVWYGKVSKETVLLTMDNHLSHHRGQMVVYLRLNDIMPPSYIGW